MNVAIIGAGNVGRALASSFTRHGHTVIIASHDPEHAAAAAAATGARAATSNAEAAAAAEVVVLAVPFASAEAVAVEIRDAVACKPVVDATNRMSFGPNGPTIDNGDSNADRLAAWLPDAHVVKAFNTLFAQVLADGPAFANGAIAPVFFAGDDKDAKEKVASLIEAIGFKPIDAGGLKNARYLEPLAGLNVYFGYGAGAGTAVAPTWISRAA
jgi:8-hydroxy-5-deazaflavin:NADPH oxidoreductase